MKKHFYSLFAAAAMMLAVTSCSQEEDFGQQSSGDLTKFSVVLEGATQSRAAGDGTQVDELYYEVWSEDGKTAIVNQTSVAVENGRAIVELPLMKNEKYDIIFWAQSSETSIYNLGKGLQNISVNYENIAGNNEENDAFFNALDNYQPKGTAQTVELRRPFAQLNIGTSLDDWKKANLLVEKDGSQMVDQISVKVTGLASTFNAMTGEASTIKDKAVEFTKANLFSGNFTTNETDYKYFAMNYLLVPGKKDPQGTNNHEADSKEDEKAKVKSNVDIEFTLYKGDDSYSTINVPNAPIQRNYRTNIIGAFLTGGETIFEVIVMPGFDEEDILYPELLLAAANGGTVTLEEDVELKGSLVVAAGKSMTINLNGHSITNTSSTGEYGKDEGIIVYGNLTIEGEGTVEANSMAIWARGAENNAEVTIKGGTYKGLSAELANSGRSVIYASGNNTINIYGGTFEAKAADKTSFADKTNGVFAALNIQDNNGKINVYGGTFINFNPAVPGTELPAWNADHENGFVADGYTSVETGNKTWEVVENKDNKEVKSIAASELQSTIDAATEPTIILLKDSYTNDNQVSIPSDKDITIIGNSSTQTALNRSVSEDEISFKGQFKVAGKLTLKDITIYTPSNSIAGEVSQYSKSAIALVNTGDVICENVTFEMANGIDEATAITAWWSTGDGANITVKNSTFNCAGQRPIRSDACVTVEKCVFNDPYRYAIQMTSKSSTMAEEAEAYVNFYNNTINAGTSRDKPVYGVQLEGGYGCSDLTINGADNVINLGSTGKVSAMYYCECGKVDHASIIWNTEVAPVHEKGYSLSEDEKTYYIASANGLVWVANQVNVERNSFADKTIALVADIDLNGIDWEPIGQTGGTEFKGVFDGQNHTIKNLNIDSDAETGKHYSSGLFGWLEGHGDDGDNIVIKNVKVDGAIVVGHHNCGTIIGYMTGKVVATNCHVKNASISCTVANDDANGDKAGVIIGNGTVESSEISNCTATDSTVSAGRDAGQIVGAANASKVKNCSAINVVVTKAEEGTGANIRNEVIGRLL